MRITHLGHAGLYIETRFGSILCDPWKNPAYFASWFVFPDNSQLDWRKYGNADYLYVSHAHQDHFDPALLSDYVAKTAIVLLPAFPLNELQRALERLGFRRFRVLLDNVVTEVDGLRLMVSCVSSPSDGPIGDSALALDDGTAVVLNQNDARPVDLDSIARFGAFDVHFLQYSGANWWPWAYRLPAEEKRSAARAKRINGFERALRYIKVIGARHVVPFAGPACFLDDSLFELNDIESSDDANTFPDQMRFLEFLRVQGIDSGHLLVPGATLDVVNGKSGISLPSTWKDAVQPFERKEEYLRSYAERVRDAIEAEKRNRMVTQLDILRELKEWFEPILRVADNICAGVGGAILLRIGTERDIILDFERREVRDYSAETCVYEFTIAQELMEQLIALHEVDWVNSLFLSMRFEVVTEGPYNEQLFAFFKSLSHERIEFTESWYRRGEDEVSVFELNGWTIQRYCPHMQADLKIFGKVWDTKLTCSMHGWEFDLTTSKCLTNESPEYSLQCKRSRPQP